MFHKFVHFISVPSEFPSCMKWLRVAKNTMKDIVNKAEAMKIKRLPNFAKSPARIKELASLTKTVLIPEI